MWDHPSLLGKLSDDKFMEIYQSCSRKIRNMLEGTYGKKVKKGRRVSLKTGKDKRIQALSVRDGVVASQDGQMAEELFKTWLYDHRPMLSAALNFFEIPNEDGITEQELDPVVQADTQKLEALLDALIAAGYEMENIALYLAVLQVEHFAEVPRLVEALGAPE